MNEKQKSNEVHDLESPLQAAVQSILAEPVPEDAVSRVQERAKQLSASHAERVQATGVARKSAPRSRRQLRLRPLARYGVVGVAVVIGLLAIVFLVDRGAAFSFADVLDKVERSRSVRFVCKLESAGRPGPETKMWLQGDFMRYEFAEGAIVHVFDTSRLKGLELHPFRKVAKEVDRVGQVPAEEFRDLIGQLRNLKQQKNVTVMQLADEMVGERNCHVFEVTGAKALRIQGKWKLWVDPKTELPVKMHVGDENNSITFEQIVWDERLDPALFAMTVPAGFVFEQPMAAKVRPGRIYYQWWKDSHSMRPDGTEPERQFVPGSDAEGGTFSSKSAELSPDGRYLAIGYTADVNRRDTAVRKPGSYPPERILLWDRTQPEKEAVEVYARPDAELNHWQFSPDGKRLYVGWWKQLPEKKWPHGLAADFVDLDTNVRKAITLPTYTSASGEKRPTQFAAASPDGKTYLVVGQHLQLISAKGKVLRQLTQGEQYVASRSVRFSPDGRNALFSANNKDGYRLCTVAISGGKPLELVPPGQFTKFRARWSPDGKRIAYTCRLYDPSHRRRVGNEAYLKIVNADGTGTTTLITQKVNPNAMALQLTAWR